MRCMGTGALREAIAVQTLPEGTGALREAIAVQTFPEDQPTQKSICLKLHSGGPDCT